MVVKTRSANRKRKRGRTVQSLQKHTRVTRSQSSKANKECSSKAKLNESIPISNDETIESVHNLSLRSPAEFRDIIFTDSWIQNKDKDSTICIDTDNDHSVSVLDNQFQTKQILLQQSHSSPKDDSFRDTELYCMANNCQFQRKYTNKMVRCCICMVSHHVKCVDLQDQTSNVWNCLNCRRIPEIIRGLTSKVNELKQTVDNLIQLNEKMAQTVILNNYQPNEKQHENKLNESILENSLSSENDSECPELVQTILPHKRPARNEKPVKQDHYQVKMTQNVLNLYRLFYHIKGQEGMKIPSSKITTQLMYH